jgi:hypothetical protein
MKKQPSRKADEYPLKITMRSLRLTGEEAQRLMEIHQAKALECYEYWDIRLQKLGIVAIVPIPPERKRTTEKWIASTWVKVRNMAGVKVPTESRLREIEGLLNQMSHASHRLSKKYSVLTDVGETLATTGRAVILPHHMAPEKRP